MAKTGLPWVLMVCLILCFGDGVPLQSPIMAGKAASRVGAMEQNATANFE